MEKRENVIKRINNVGVLSRQRERERERERVCVCWERRHENINKRDRKIW